VEEEGILPIKGETDSGVSYRRRGKKERLKLILSGSRIVARCGCLPVISNYIISQINLMSADHPALVPAFGFES
jgi:hypothetical protein